MPAATGLPLVEAKPGLAECLDGLAARKDQNRPVSTYRMQLNAGFKFEEARRLLPYLHALGITHVYLSPILQAHAGSVHGYDITDHNRLNPEIGSDEEFAAFVSDARNLGLGLVVDIVPNHMGVGHGTNPWWQDVLENGQASAYANFFDIDWRPLKRELEGKVLLPVLGGQYGDELENGNIKLNYSDGSFYISYYDKHFPLDPHSYPMVFGALGDLRQRQSGVGWQESEYPALQEIIAGVTSLPPQNSDDFQQIVLRQQRIPQLKAELAELASGSSRVRGVIDDAIALVNGQPGNAASFNTLHRILEVQAYRLAHWRVSAEEINYRRFFDVNDLVGLRMENPQVFAGTHKLIRKLLADGSINGLRLDHPDGLYNPIQYFTRIQMLYCASQCCGPQSQAPRAENGIEQDVMTVFGEHDWTGQGAPLYLLVEKILEPGESLPKEWPVDGTVGYEFGNVLNNLFIDQRNRRAFTNLYHRFIGGPVDVDLIIYNSKSLIMRSALSSELTVLTHLLEELCSTDRRARDFTRGSLRAAIREVIACFPVYRTYIDERGNVGERDRAYIQEAIARAKRRNTETNPAIFDFLRSILLLESDAIPLSAENYRKRLRFTLKFQQLTAPVMAKGLEDTACYVYNRFVSVNEVGGSPKQFGISVEDFHAGNQERARQWPFSMLNTSTHDSKRSEDVRARLNVLSEMPQAWVAEVFRWRRANRAKKRTLGDGRVVPDHNEEYLLYQTLAGAWPFNFAAERETFVERIQAYMNKAVNEAKVNLSWTSPNEDYSRALHDFVSLILDPGSGRRPNAFLDRVHRFLPPIMFFGAINSLSQVLLKITSPGVPDIYRGQEIWDLSLVDPDNRRPVDYGIRERFAGELLSRAERERKADICAELLSAYADGRLKLWTTLQAMRVRREHASLFRGQYLPLFAVGQKQQHLIAFMWQDRDLAALVAVPRFGYSLMRGALLPPIGNEPWADTEIALPPQAPLEYVNAFTGERVRTKENRVSCGEVFAHFPVALLISL